MLVEIASYQIFGKPILVYLGMATLSSFLLTALIGYLNFKGNHTIPFKWHPRMAAFSITLALIHAFLGIAISF